MNASTRRALFWTPRILTVAFALFLALFALDVFDEGYSIGETVAALFMHLIPNFLLVAILIVAWRREWVGAILFSGLGVFYLVMTWGRMHWGAYLGISGPLFLMGLLFLLNWIYREEIRPPAETV
jgi:hypothetical protein